MEGPTRKSSSRKEKQNGGTSIIDIPDHILMEICARLSVKSICRSRCVCKTWSHVLNNTDFSKLHFEKANICPIFRNCKVGYSHSESLYLFEIERDSYFNDRGNLNLDTVFKLPPRAKKSFGSELVNSCNGFLCLKGRYDTNPIVIYNPVTGEYTILPIPEEAKKCVTVIVLGLGFCPTSKLYKVLLTAMNKITCYRCSNSSACREMMAFVYTFGLAGGWRKIKKVPCFYRSKTKIRNPVFLNGALHWLVPTWRLESTAIMSFDLEGEFFYYLPTPDVCLRSLRNEVEALNIIGIQCLELGIIRGQLCLVDRMYAPSVKVELWVLKDYGVGNYWTEEHLIDDFAAGENGESWSPGLCQSIDFANSWDFLFHSSKEKFFYFTDKNKVMRCLKIGESRHVFGVTAYVPSLYSLKEIVAGSLEVLNC